MTPTAIHMTAEEIKAAIDIDGITVRESDNGEYYWVVMSTTVNDRPHSHSIRLSSKTPTPDELASAQKTLESWYAEEQRDT